MCQFPKNRLLKGAKNVFKIIEKKTKTILFLCLIAALLTACQNKERKNAPVSLTPSPTADEQIENENSPSKLIGDVVFVHGNRDSYSLEFDTDEENTLGTILWYTGHKDAKKMVISRQVHLQWLEDDLDTEQSNYTSNVAMCPQLTEICVEEGNDMVYARDGILYKYEKDKKDGLLACPPAKEGPITIQKNARTIWSCAFNGCHKITSIQIPETIHGIGDAAFGDMPDCQEILVSDKNPYYKSVDGVLYTKDGKVLLAYPAGKKDKVFRVPDGVTYIASGAFMKADHLTKVILPKSVDQICEAAFRSCDKLRTVKTKGTISYVHRYAFYLTLVKREGQLKKSDPVNRKEWRKQYHYFGFNKKNQMWITGYRGVNQ